MTPKWYDYYPLFVDGALITLQITVLSGLLASLGSITVGLARLSASMFLRWGAIIFIEFFRGTSLLVQLFWIFFALPFLGVSLSALTSAVLAIGLNSSAYGAEVVRSAVQAVPVDQYEACIA